jgi:hypothetical protein
MCVHDHICQMCVLFVRGRISIIVRVSRVVPNNSWWAMNRDKDDHTCNHAIMGRNYEATTIYRSTKEIGKVCTWMWTYTVSVLLAQLSVATKIHCCNQKWRFICIYKLYIFCIDIWDVRVTYIFGTWVHFFFSRIHPRRCINHIEKRLRRPVQSQEGYNSTPRYNAKRQTTHPLHTWW